MTDEKTNRETVQDSVTNPNHLQVAEEKFIQERRAAAGTSGIKVGFGLSGGGIRSATFALGFFQSLARAKLIGYIDYLSTVSGGGYFGAFLGSLYARKAIEGIAPEVQNASSKEQGEKTTPVSTPTPQSQSRVDEVESILSVESKSVKWLRENGRYLAPNGPSDLLQGIASVFRNWWAVHLVIGITILLGFLLSQLLALLAGPYGLGLVCSGFWFSPYFILAGVPLLLVVVPMGFAYWVMPYRHRELAWPYIGLLVILAGVVSPIWIGATPIFDSPTSFATLIYLLLYLLPLVTILYVVVNSMENNPKSDLKCRFLLTRWLKRGMVTSLGLVLFALVDSLGRYVYFQGICEGNFLVLGGGTPLVGLAWLGRKLVTVANRGEGRPFRGLASFASIGAASLLFGLLLVFYSGLSHYVTWGGEKPKNRYSASVEQKTEEAVQEPASGMQKDPLQNNQGLGEQLPVNGFLPRFALAVSDSLDNFYRIWSEILGDRLDNLRRLIIALGACLLLVLGFGWTWPLLNLSSHHPVYRARLARAYLGAANPNRFDEVTGLPICEPNDDDIEQVDYKPHEKGGPLHLINVTINETVDGQSNIQQQDRRGTNLVFGPHGFSVGSHHHALSAKCNTSGNDRFKVFPDGAVPTSHEKMTLSKWVAISGAAFSTGVGARTNISLSILAFLANIRLGYWWNSGINPSDRNNEGTPKTEKTKRRLRTFWQDFFPVQHFLFREMLSRFPGTAYRYWYLSDGGHFENLGGYELIRRRLPLIVLLDGSSDPEYRFEDLGNLVRKARIDFGARIEFIDPKSLKDSKDIDWLGNLHDLRPAASSEGTGKSWFSAEKNPQAMSRAHAAVARVHYPDPNQSPTLLVYIKPTMTGSEPPDLIHFRGTNPDFPHESTLDQFFDEAQWESYRALGELIGQKIFGNEQYENFDEFISKVRPKKPSK